MNSRVSVPTHLVVLATLTFCLTIVAMIIALTNNRLIMQLSARQLEDTKIVLKEAEMLHHRLDTLETRNAR